MTAQRVFTAPILLPADPTLSLQASTKSYVDAVATASVPTSRTVTAGSGLSGGGALSSNITLTAARVTSPANTVTYSATLALDPTLGNNQNITATGALSLSISTTGAIDGQMVMVSVLASGAQRTVTLTSTNIPAGQSSVMAITSGKCGLFGFRYVGLISAWVLMSSMQTV